MPFYRYQVRDKGGKTLEGTISAPNEGEAQYALSQRGFQVLRIGDTAAAPKPAPVTRPASAPAPAPAPVRTVASAPTVTRTDTVRTRPGSDKLRLFLFSQVGSILRSGVTPHVGLTDLASRSRHSGYRRFLEDAAKSTASGGALSETMARYPHLFPPDNVGTIRAAEAGGFLPEAFSALTDQAETSHRLRRRMFYWSFLLIGMLVMYPVALGVINGALETIRRQDAAGGSISPWGTLMNELGKSLPAVVPGALLAAALIYGFITLWNSLPLRRLRHQLIYVVPVFAGRARSESMARFAWVMQMLSRAGLPPQQVFRLAAESVPSLVVRERLIREGEQMQEHESLGKVLERTRIVPDEQFLIVQNGELVGDVPGALATVARAQDAEFRGKDDSFTHRFQFILYPVAGLIIVFLAYKLLVAWYVPLQSIILGES